MTKFFTTALNTVSPSSSNKDRDVAFWHICDMPTVSSDVRFQGNPEDICSH